MESKKAFYLLTLVFSLLVIEKSMVSPVLAQNNHSPDNDHGRSGVHGHQANTDKKWHGNSSDDEVQVPPPATKTRIEVSTAVSPTSKASSTSVTKSSNNSSTSATGGATTSQSTSAKVNEHGSSSSSSSSVTYKNHP